MNRAFRWHVLLLVCTGLSVMPAARAQDPAQAAGLHALLAELPHAQTKVSACFIRLPEGTTVYERHADQPLIPASNQKIISGAAALDILGPDHHFETRLLQVGDDLIIVGSGDPGFGDPKLAAERDEKTEETFLRWADALRKRGITRVAGDIIVDDRAFDQQWVHPSWEPSDLSKWYAAPVGALNFNDNCIEVTLWPTSPGAAVGYDLFPPTDWIVVVNNCTTGKKAPWIMRRDLNPTFVLRGQCSKRTTLKSVAISDPGIFAGQVFKQVLQSKGMPVAGSVRRVAADAPPPDPSAVIATHRTSMTAALGRSLSHSQNFFAECLMKAAGARASATPASWPVASRAIVDRLSSWGVPSRGMIVADGSGLSRENRVSARQITEVLEYMYLDRRSGEIFMKSLSHNGKHGTLRRRMADISGRVRAKSGYLKGVRCLSGYVLGERNRWYAFSILFNDIRGGTAPYNEIHDAACRVLAEGD